MKEFIRRYLTEGYESRYEFFHLVHACCNRGDESLNVTLHLLIILEDTRGGL